MTQFSEKNPNGGYLNKSNYGEDSWYGKVTITSAFLAQHGIQGPDINVIIEAKDVQTTQYGECRRCVVKKYTPKQQAAPQQQYQQPQQHNPQGFAGAPATQGYAPPPTVQQPAPPPVQAPAALVPDEIPF